MHSPENMAQRWHDTDHGKYRPVRSRPYYGVVWSDDAGPPAEVADCWCCCELCDPGSSERPNPFWTQATAVGSVRFTDEAELEDKVYACLHCVEVYESVRELLKHVRKDHCG